MTQTPRTSPNNKHRKIRMGGRRQGLPGAFGHEKGHCGEFSSFHTASQRSQTRHCRILHMGIANRRRQEKPKAPEKGGLTKENLLAIPTPFQPNASGSTALLSAVSTGSRESCSSTASWQRQVSLRFPHQGSRGELSLRYLAAMRLSEAGLVTTLLYCSPCPIKRDQQEAELLHPPNSSKTKHGLWSRAISTLLSPPHPALSVGLVGSWASILPSISETEGGCAVYSSWYSTTCPPVSTGPKEAALISPT